MSTSTRLIHIRLRKFEGVLDQFATWFGFTVGDYFYDIESKNDVGIVQQTQPGERASRDLSLLKRLNVFEWPAQIFARSRFYFDEYKRVAVAADNIDLTSRTVFEITVKNFVAAFPEKSAGGLFPESTAPDVFRLFR